MAFGRFLGQSQEVNDRAIQYKFNLVGLGAVKIHKVHRADKRMGYTLYPLWDHRRPPILHIRSC